MAGFVACGCNHLDVAGLFIASSEGVQERFVQSKEIAENLKVEGLDANEDYTFYVATDPHVDQTHMNLDVFTDTFRNDPEASFGVILDTASGTLGAKQTRWFKEFIEKNRSSYRHCVVLTHTNLFYTDNSQTSSGNMPLEETYSLIDFLARNDISLVLQGHDHYREDITYRNVRYTIVGAIADKCKSPEYLRVEVTPDGLNLDWCLISYI